MRPCDAGRYAVVVCYDDEPRDRSLGSFGGAKKTWKGPIGKAVGISPTGQGNDHIFKVANFTRTFGIVDPSAVGQCLVQAYIDKEIGGDGFSGNPVVSP